MIDLDSIKEELSHMKCSEHSRHSTIERDGDSLVITSCCQNFADKVNKKYGELLQEQTLGQLKGLFRKK